MRWCLVRSHATRSGSAGGSATRPSSRFEGMDADLAPAETVLHGPVTDQAGLHGLLDRIQSLGLELIEVRRLPGGSRDLSRAARVRAPPGARVRARAAHTGARHCPLPAGPVGLTAVSSALAVRSSVPPVPAATVARPRLEAALDAGRAGALTLVGAPPGWGKTVLLSGWAADNDAAWLTLGACHSDSRRLWADVCERARPRGHRVRRRRPAAARRRAGRRDGAPRARARRPRPAARPRARLARRAARPRRRRAARGRGDPLRSPAPARAPAAVRPPARAARRRPRVHARGGDRAAGGARALAAARRSSRACSSAPRAGPPGCGSPGCRCAARPTPTRSWPSSPATIAPSPTT